jgi:hypothetical protein
MNEVKKEGGINSSLPAPYEDDGTDYWQGHLEGWHKSGLSQAAYCRSHNLKYVNFRKWKERLSTYPVGSSLKLVELRRDFPLNVNAPSYSQNFGSVGSAGYCSQSSRTIPTRPRTVVNGGSLVGNRQAHSGIRFWCGEFCIEVEVEFCSKSLSQLIQTLQGLQNMNPYPNPDVLEGVNKAAGRGSESE